MGSFLTMTTGMMIPFAIIMTLRPGSLNVSKEAVLAGWGCFGLMGLATLN